MTMTRFLRSWGWGPPKPPDPPKPKISRLERWLSVSIPVMWIGIGSEIDMAGTARPGPTWRDAARHGEVGQASP